ncbi:hypothetical protein [Salinispora arenicola]|uniref:Uncharacterized protein n=1 Tax=Salinispora arenicola TaxID=168697 RepID=A0A542XJB3_SALAC|nr:hypothetical protein [Salinispora arenicola]NIL59491.1 hypothetical protein [Salinispora arenicola]NIL60880.1 hypothetical protein [Salinispora arenicola]TQL35948.1 hypothetical protein FB564_1019 [Salinispora arenicola]GIM82864.1 hypothetical protein Sar04_09350 [Salinispora arenicola]
MGKSRHEKRAAIREHKEARRDRCESDAYLDANSRVIKAERNIPWWRR